MNIYVAIIEAWAKDMELDLASLSDYDLPSFLHIVRNFPHFKKNEKEGSISNGSCIKV